MKGNALIAFAGRGALVSELFPISSLGHSVLIPKVLGWDINQTSSAYLTFLVAIHFATAVVLFLFFFKDWLLIFKGLARSFAKRQIDSEDTYAVAAVESVLYRPVLGLLLKIPLPALVIRPISISPANRERLDSLNGRKIA